MKFKFVLVVLFLSLFLSSNLYSQKYQKMLGDSNSWSEYDVSYLFGSHGWSYTTKKDTIIKSIKYKVLSGDGFLREDSVQRKVYHLPYAGNEEVLLYDFSLKVGDYFKFNSLAAGKLILKVSDIDTIGGRIIKLKLDSGRNYLDSILWIEGVGCNRSLIYGHIWKDPDNNVYLACAYRNGKRTYLNPDGYPCYIKYVSTTENIKSAISVTTFPNPSIGTYTLSFSDNFSGSIFVYDIFGKLSYHQMINNTKSMEIEFNGSAGIYYLKLVDEIGKNQGIKLIKQ